MTGNSRFPLKALALAAAAFFLCFFAYEIFLTLRYKPYEKELAKAQQAREEGDLEAAEKILLELEKKNPEEPAAYIELSYVYEDMGILEPALDQAQLAWGKTHKALGKGRLFLNRLRLMRWKDNLKQRIEDLPMAIHGQEAIRDWSMGDREGALRKLRLLQEKYPSSYQPQAAVAMLYKNSGDFEESIAEAQGALQKIDAQLALRKMNAQTKKLIQQDRDGLQAMIDELREFYAEE